MANVFKPKRSSTASSVPTTSDLADGELAVNSADQKIYLRSGGSVVEVGNVAAGGGGISDILEDTTPQLGGNLDVNGKNINFGDSASASDDRLNFGAGADFSIYHNGSNSYIDVVPDAQNHLYIRNNVTNDFNGKIFIQAKAGENSIYCSDDAGVSLYYDAAHKFQTTSTGFSVTGTGLGNWKTNDNGTITAGTGDDFQIYHDATNTYLDNDTGHIFIRNNVAGDVNGDIYIQAKSGENSIYCADDSSVYLYSDNSLKLQTTSTGITVTGTGLGNWKANDSGTITAGTGDDFQIYHDGTNTYLDNDTGHIYIRNASTNDNSNIYIQAVDGENSILCADDSSVYLYYDNALKLQTTSAGVTITGTLSVSTLAFADDQKMTFGASSDLEIYHNGTDNNSYIDNITGHLYLRNAGANDNSNIYIQAVDGENSILCTDDSSVYLYHDNALKFQTSSTGFTVTGTGLGNFKANDSGTITAGTGDDLKIYHDGTNSYIDVVPDAQNHLYIRNNVTNDFNGDIYIQAKSGENSIVCSDDAGVILYYDAAWKLQTTSTGVTINGALSVTTLDFADSQKLRFGTGLDAEIYHDGTNTYFDNDTGHIFIRNNVAADVGSNIYIQARSGENSIICNDDGNVTLYYDNAYKLQTTSTGITVNGTGLGNWKTNDNGTITAGTSDDLQIYHYYDSVNDISASYIDNDTGHLYIRNNVDNDDGSNIYIQAKSGENSIICNDDSSVQLYHNNSLKLATASGGINVTGTCEAGGLKVNDSAYITAGLGDDFQIYHDATSTYLDNDTGHIYIRNNVAGDVNGDIYLQAKSGEHSIACLDDSEVRLYYDGAEKLNTSATGVTVTGALTATTIVKSGGTSSQFLMADGSVSTGASGDVVDDTTPQLGGNLDVNGKNINFGDSASSSDDRLHFGASSDLEIYHNGTNSRICDRGTGNLQLISNSNIVLLHQDDETDAGVTIAKFFSDGANELYHNGTKKFETTSTGVDVSGSLEADNSVVVKSDDGTSGRIDLYCESANAHYARIQAPAHANFSGNVTITLPNSTGTLLNSDGSGANLTALNASNLGSGTVPDARFPATLPAVSGASLTGLTGVSHGTYGDASNVAQIAVDTNGRITSITEVAISGGGGGASEAFKTISVSGQSDVVADSATDTLTLVAGSNMTITTNATGDSITFASTGGGGGGSGITRAQSIISAIVFS
jgi:hypothetical protein